MLPRKIFENLHTVMVILALFELFSGKVCSYFGPLTLNALSNMMHFVSTVSIMRVKAIKAYYYEQECKSMLSIGGDDLAKSTIFRFWGDDLVKLARLQMSSFLPTMK